MNSPITTILSLENVEQQLELIQKRLSNNDLEGIDSALSDLELFLNNCDSDYFLLQDELTGLKIQFLIISGRFDDLEKSIQGKEGILNTTIIRLGIANGIINNQKGKYRASLSYFLEAEKRAKELENKTLNAQIQMNIGTVYAGLMHYRFARDRYETVLEEYELELSNNIRSILLHNLGNVYYALGEYKSSKSALEKSKSRSQEGTNDKLNTKSQILLNRSLIALNLPLESITKVPDTDSLFHIHLLSKAKTLIKGGDTNTAILKLEQSFIFAEKNKDYGTQIEALEQLIKIYKEKEDYALAYKWLTQLRNSENELKILQGKARLIEQKVQFDVLQREQEIQNLIKEKTLQDEIIKRNEQLEVANEDLRQFAYVVSHDLKEPLRMIGSYTQLIRMTMSQDVSADQTEYFEFVKGGVERLNRLLDGLSNYSSLKSLGEINGKYLLSTLVDEAKKNLDTLLKEFDAEVIVDSEDEINVSEALFVLLFQNLIQNAVKFRQKEIRPIITFRTKREPGKQLILIRDNGIGIPKDQQERVFVIFQRLSRNDYEGTGMGLAICKKIVQLHDGKIMVDSSTSAGTVMKIELPDQGYSSSKN